MHLACLFLDRHILVDDTDTTLSGNRDSHLGLGHGIHGCRHQRHIQNDVSGKFSLEFDASGKHFGISGNKQDIIKSETVHSYPVCNK